MYLLCYYFRLNNQLYEVLGSCNLRK
uniref:Uncharacterized protein n=1 Tax=Anopheles dirus TaxID=7168 RepID=A0A182NWN9_9DIPT